MDQFRKFLNQPAHQVHRQDIQENASWLKWQIKREVFTTLFGLNDGYKVELQNDPQLEKAISLIPQSKALYANARKIVATRESAQGSRP